TETTASQAATQATVVAAPEHATAAEAAEQHRQKSAAEHQQHEDEVERQSAATVMVRLRRLIVPPQHVENRMRAGDDTLVELARLETRRDDIADDIAAQGIG